MEIGVGCKFAFQVFTLVTQSMELVLVSLQFLLSCVSDTKALASEEVEGEMQYLLNKKAKEEEKRKNPCPEETASVLSGWFYAWFTR